MGTVNTVMNIATSLQVHYAVRDKAVIGQMLISMAWMTAPGQERSLRSHLKVTEKFAHFYRMGRIGLYFAA